MRRGIPIIAFAAAALLAAAPAPAASTGLDDLYRALEPHLPIATQHINQIAIDAALQAIDPHAERMPRGEAPAPATPAIVASAVSWPEGIVHARLNGVYATDRREAIGNLRALLTTNAIGLILDLRGAGGHDLDTLDALAGLFFPPDSVIYELRDGYGNVLAQHVARADERPPALPPIMLLIDGRTYGASEALAALLHDHAGVMLLGETTGGDAAQRTRVPWSETHDLHVGTAWLVPISGDAYHPAGVQPHVPILPPPTTLAPTNTLTHAVPATAPASTNEPAAATKGPTLAERVGNDPLLRRATDIILGLHALHQP